MRSTLYAFSFVVALVATTLSQAQEVAVPKYRARVIQPHFNQPSLAWDMSSRGDVCVKGAVLWADGRLEKFSRPWWPILVNSQGDVVLHREAKDKYNPELYIRRFGGEPVRLEGLYKGPYDKRWQNSSWRLYDDGILTGQTSSPGNPSPTQCWWDPDGKLNLMPTGAGGNGGRFGTALVSGSLFDFETREVSMLGIRHVAMKDASIRMGLGVGSHTVRHRPVAITLEGEPALKMLPLLLRSPGRRYVNGEAARIRGPLVYGASFRRLKAGPRAYEGRATLWILPSMDETTQVFDLTRLSSGFNGVLERVVGVDTGGRVLCQGYVGSEWSPSAERAVLLEPLAQQVSTINKTAAATPE